MNRVTVQTNAVKRGKPQIPLRQRAARKADQQFDGSSESVNDTFNFENQQPALPDLTFVPVTGGRDTNDVFNASDSLQSEQQLSTPQSDAEPGVVGESFDGADVKEVESVPSSENVASDKVTKAVTPSTEPATNSDQNATPISQKSEESSSRPSQITPSGVSAVAATQTNGAKPVQHTGVRANSASMTADSQNESTNADSEISVESSVKGDDTPTAPSSPEEDSAFQAVLNAGRATAALQQSHVPAKRKASDAQAAVLPPSNERQSKAEAAQIDQMSAAKPAPFNRIAFIESLRGRISASMPQTIGDAREFKSRGRASEVKNAVVGEVSAGKHSAEASIAEATHGTPDASAIPQQPVTELPPTNPGQAPQAQSVGIEQAAPKQKTDEQVSLAGGQQRLDQQMADAAVTDEQLQKSNEPSFVSALETKNASSDFSSAGPAAFRQDESQILSGAREQAATTGSAAFSGMHSARSGQFQNVIGHQQKTKSVEESQRAEVAGQIETLFQQTQTQVQQRLASLDTEVMQVFDQGAASATRTFEDYVEREKNKWEEERYGGFIGKLQWLDDKWSGLPPEVNLIYQRGKEEYVHSMEQVIGSVADTVERGLNDATKMIADGRKSVRDMIDSLPQHKKKFGEEAVRGIQARFDLLGDSVRQHEEQFVETLTAKYVENLQAVDQRITTMKENDKGLVDKAFDAMSGVIQTITQLKDLLLSVVSSAVDVIGQIIRDPITFVGNLVAGVGQGLQSFLANIGVYLQQGLMGWLFGALASAGVRIPQSFDIKSIFGLAMDVIGMTYQAIKARAVRLVGEKTVARMEQASEIFRVLLVEGPMGLWDHIKERLTEFNDIVVSGIENFVVTRVIKAGITWILSLLNPAAAFVKAMNAIISIVQFFVERGSQLIELVQAITGSLAAIASGSVGAVAKSVETALGKAIPVTIGFLASVLGLGNIGETIRGLIERIRKPIMGAVDWVIGKAIGLVGKDRKESGQTGSKTERIAQGIAAIRKAETPYLEQGEIEKPEAEAVARQVQSNHPVFTSMNVQDGGSSWNYVYTASPSVVGGKTKKDITPGGDDQLAPFQLGDHVYVREPMPGEKNLLATIAEFDDKRKIVYFQIVRNNEDRKTLTRTKTRIGLPISQLHDSKKIGRATDANTLKLVSADARRELNQKLIDDPEGLISDPALEGVVGLPTADHIVSVREIAQMDGFAVLTYKQKVQVLSVEWNGQVLTQQANSAKGSKPASKFMEHKRSGHKVREEFNAKMIKDEPVIRRRLEQLISDLVKENNRKRS